MPDDARERADPLGLGRAAAGREPLSSTVPFEQIGQSAVKRLWRQKSEFNGVGKHDIQRAC